MYWMSKIRERSCRVLALACALFGGGFVVGEPPPAVLPALRSTPSLEEVLRVYRGADAQPETAAQLFAALSSAEVVFAGETHLDETTHRLELRLLEELERLAPGKVVLALEMFERDVQPQLDAYLAGTNSESEFLRTARPWSNYATGYRPLIEFARARGLPVVASNFPTPLRRKLAGEGASGIAALSDADRAHVPTEILLSGPAYWERYQRVLRGHMGGPGSQDPEALRYSTQSLWDNSMGEACARALERFPGYRVLHINGGFHSAYKQGTVEQLMKRRPTTRVLTIDIVPVDDLAISAPSPLERLRDPNGAIADYIACVERRARDYSDGSYATVVKRELEYKLRLPDVSPGARVPLLVWLVSDGLRAADGERYLRLAFGETVALAVIEPPFVETEDDFHLGGRWYREESFDDHMSALVTGIENIVADVAAKFPIDRERIVVAGQGTGATVVTQAMISSSQLPVQGFAFAPTRYRKLGEQGLGRAATIPPPLFPFEYQDLTVYANAKSIDWWRHQAEDHRTTGMRIAVREIDVDDPMRQEENSLRAALGCEPLPAATDGTPSRLLVLGVDSPLARYWAALEARVALRDGVTATVIQHGETATTIAAHPGTREGRFLAFPGEPVRDAKIQLDANTPFEWVGLPGAAVVAQSDGLPLAPGPFGGTTVVVLLKTTPPEERAAWDEVVKSEAIRRRSRTASLEIADAEGERGLAPVLAGIVARGRSNVLIVPAAYCASAEHMRELARATDAFADQLTIHWLPGLGGALSAAKSR
ncbi:MAG: ChaN family lipoprotein [Planctomycetota bacterium]